MKVKKLIEELRKANDKDVEVFIFRNDEIYPIELIDLSISDRVDININSN